MHREALTVTGKTIGENYATSAACDPEIIRPYDQPAEGERRLPGGLRQSVRLRAGQDVRHQRGFPPRFLSDPGAEDCFVARVIVFDGPEDYRRRINDPSLKIDETLHAGGARRGPDRAIPARRKW